MERMKGGGYISSVYSPDGTRIQKNFISCSGFRSEAETNFACGGQIENRADRPLRAHPQLKLNWMLQPHPKSKNIFITIIIFIAIILHCMNPCGGAPAWWAK